MGCTLRVRPNRIGRLAGGCSPGTGKLIEIVLDGFAPLARLALNRTDELIDSPMGLGNIVFSQLSPTLADFSLNFVPLAFMNLFATHGYAFLGLNWNARWCRTFDAKPPRAFKGVIWIELSHADGGDIGQIARKSLWQPNPSLSLMASSHPG